MGLLKAVLSIAMCFYIYRYITDKPNEVRKIKFIGDYLVAQNPLIIIIISLILLNLIL